ncbi:MAG: hypothetical protein CBARDCOR_3353 [uncultured Caballeronia sp.]|nr:MAG: hypothetical protein CBARDCOR_3353 [uncultured Caballeronia sp.]
MTVKIDYLSVGEDVFGPNYSEAKVLTVTPQRAARTWRSWWSITCGFRRTSRIM